MGESRQCQLYTLVRMFALSLSLSLSLSSYRLRFFFLFCCSDPREYLERVMKVTNMSCLTPEGALSGDCDFLSANMYARSLFGS